MMPLNISFEKFRMSDGSINLFKLWAEIHKGEVTMNGMKIKDFFASIDRIRVIKSRQLAAITIAIADALYNNE